MIMRGDICVYMFDGERPWSSWESPQFCAHIGPARDRTRLRRGRPRSYH